MLKFDEEKQLASVQGALALRPRIEAVVDGICKDGFRNLCWLGIGGTYASCLQAQVHMKERSDLDLFVEMRRSISPPATAGWERAPSWSSPPLPAALKRW